VFATTGYFDVPEGEALISESDQKLLQKMNNNNDNATNPSKMEDAGDGSKNLADLIMQKMQAGDFIDGDKLDMRSNMSDLKDCTLDPKVIAAYKKVGVVMRSFKSGKLPKAFKVIPQL